MNIRNATAADASRMAEIYVFNNRMFYWPIFKDDEYSFGQLQVVPLAQDYFGAAAVLPSLFVCDDGLVKGFVQLQNDEVQKLYVDPFFQGQSVGAALLRFAVQRGARFLWALEKNERALAFYARHGFVPTGARKPEEGTAEYLVKLARKGSA